MGNKFPQLIAKLAITARYLAVPTMAFASSCPFPNIMTFYMEAFPNCTVENISDNYWTCPTPGHIHPVLGEPVVMDDNTFSVRSGVCPCDLYSMLNEDSKLNWSCYQDECY